MSMCASVVRWAGVQASTRLLLKTLPMRQCSTFRSSLPQASGATLPVSRQTSQVRQRQPFVLFRAKWMMQLPSCLSRATMRRLQIQIWSQLSPNVLAPVCVHCAPRPSRPGTCCVIGHITASANSVLLPQSGGGSTDAEGGKGTSRT